MNLKNYIVFLILVLTPVGQSLGQEVAFKRLSTQHGLSQNDVRFIYQDTRGFMWIGTYDGLNRYDGYDFKIYRNEPGNSKSLVSNLVSCVAEDKNGNLWIGTDDRGISVFDRETETFTRLSNEDNKPPLFTSNQIVRLLIDIDGFLWIGTPHGLNRVLLESLASGEFDVEHFVNEPNNANSIAANRVRTIFQDKFSNIWIGTPMGMQRIIPSTGPGNKAQFISYLPSDNLDNRGLGDGVQQIIAGKEGLFIAYNGIVFLDYDEIATTNPEFESISQTPATCIILDKNGYVWGGSSNGVVRYELSENRIVSSQRFINNWLDESSLSKDLVNVIYEDNTGIVWFGTNGGGLNLYNPYKKKFLHYRKTENNNSLSYNKIRAVFEDSNENLWIGTQGGGLNLLQGSEKYSYENGFEHIDLNLFSSGQNFGYVVAEQIIDEKSRNIWIGTGHSYFIVMVPQQGPQKGIPIKPPVLDSISNPVMSMAISSKQEIWIGTYGSGIYRLKMDAYGRGSFLNHYQSDPDNPYSLSSNIIRSLYFDHDSNLWIGTDNGLNKLPWEEQVNSDPVFISYNADENDPQSISHDYILPIFQSASGDLWIGTMGGGLNRLIEGKDGRKDAFEAIAVTDGLPNNTIKGILEDDNYQLWISSNKGLTKYNPRTRSITNFDINDGLQDNEFSELACFKRKNGEMIFGGVNGFSVFNPESIGEDVQETKIVFTELQVLNNVVEIGEEINGRQLLTKSITETEEVILKYSERSFTISFAGLHFGAPAKNKYKYKLEGFDEDWINAFADMRSARYTNLSPGDYVFTVQGSNSDGVWASKAASIKFTIITPLWQTKGALAFYLAALLLILWFFRRYSIIAVREKNRLVMEHFEKEKIEELSQMKLRFFTNISHEFRTPLTLIIGPLEKLMERAKDFTTIELKNQYSIMYRNAKVLLNLINQLMDFRKLEQGKMKLKVSQGDIVSFIENIRLAFGELAKNKKIKLLFKSALTETSIWFDADKLEKILYNLLSNAFKVTPEKGTITIELSDQYQSGHLQIKISDTGMGIPSEMQSHLFERFYQADKPTGKGLSGTGIGLSFVKGLVELHHGSIKFSSIQGKGTIFHILIPVNKEEYSADEIEQDRVFVAPDESNINSWLDPESVQEVQDIPDRKERDPDMPKILIIEDNQDILAYLKDSLYESFEVLEASNGQEGLQVSMDENPDLVISDVMMPLMDGFEYCMKMKSDDQTSHIPIILLTAKDTKEDQIKGYEFGADDYVSKPFNMNVLLARINGLLEARKRFQERFRQTIDLDPSDEQITSIDQRFLNRLIGIIEEFISDPEFTVEKLASEYGIAQVILNRKLKAIVNQTARAFIRSIRLKRAAQLLKKGRYSVADVTYEVGFSDLKYFRDCFKKEFNKTPSEYIHDPT